MFTLLLALTLSFAPPDQVFEPVEITPPAQKFEPLTFENDPIGVQQFVLDNGLTVLLSENHERPEVFGAVVVRTGGKNDPADNTGMAHYLEHMLFKGTQTLGTSNWAAEAPLQDKLVELYERHKRADTDEARAKLQAEIAKVVEQTYDYVIPNELSNMLLQLGIWHSAFTSEDETVYHERFPASQLETWMEICTHRFVDPVFRQFPTELEIAYEEKNKWLDNFELVIHDEFMARAFPQHPYGTQTVLGEVEHLKAPSLVALQDYFDKYYVANNMALVLVGDFDGEAILPTINEHFGGWRRGPEPEPRTGSVEPFVGRERAELRVTPFRIGAYAFRTPTARHPDHAAVQIVHELLYNHEQRSGLINELEDEGELLGATWFSSGFADHGLDIVMFAPRILGQTFKDAEQQVLEQCHRIAHGDFEERQMLAIRDRLVRAEDRQWETNEDRGLAMAHSFVHHDGWQGYLDYRAGLAGTSREDVMRVAATYFADDYLSLRSRVGAPKKPRLSKPSYPPVRPRPNVHSSFYTQIMARPSPAPNLRFVAFAADVTIVQMAEHVVLRTNENPFNDTYSLDLVFGVGTDRIRELFVAAEYLQEIGTRRHSPTALRDQLALLGTTLSITVTDDQLHVELTGPEPHLPAAVDLVEGLLHEPVADDQRWKTLRRTRAAFEEAGRQFPEDLRDALLHYVMFGERSMFLRDYGRQGARSLKPKELIAAWQRAQGYGLEVRYAGQRAPDEVAEILQRSLARSLELPREPAVPYVVRERILPDRDTVFFLPRRKQIQTHLFFIVDGEPVPREQVAAADAYSQYMSGLVFEDILESRALAYSVAAFYVRSRDPGQPGWLGGVVACQADKTFDSIDAMMALIRNPPARSDRMHSSRSILMRSLEMQSPGFRELQSTIADWRRRGYDDDPRKWLLEDYTKLESADIEAFHAAQVAARPVISLVVGDPRRVDVRELARYGEVIEVSERELFAR